MPLTTIQKSKACGLICKTNHAKAGDDVNGFFVLACDRPTPEYSDKGKEHGRMQDFKTRVNEYIDELHMQVERRQREDGAFIFCFEGPMMTNAFSLCC